MHNLSLEERIERMESIIKKIDLYKLMDPTERLLVSENWTDSDLERCYDIFEKYDNLWSKNLKE